MNSNEIKFNKIKELHLKNLHPKIVKRKSLVIFSNPGFTEEQLMKGIFPRIPKKRIEQPCGCAKEWCGFHAKDKKKQLTKT